MPYGSADGFGGLRGYIVGVRGLQAAGMNVYLLGCGGPHMSYVHYKFIRVMATASYLRYKKLIFLHSA